MLKRLLHSLVFGTVLASAAAFMLPADSLAVGAACRCPADECACCCTQHEPEEASVQFQYAAAPETCTCSTGPNPYSTDDAAAAVYLDPPKKRFFQPNAVAVEVVYTVSAGLPAKRHKPPAESSQRLYLLKSSFLI